MSDQVATPVADISAPIQANPDVKSPEPVIEKPKSEDFLAPKFAALTRKEKEIRAEAARIKAEREQIEQMRAEYESKSKSSVDAETSFKEKLRKNPLKTLSELGLTYEQLTEMQLNDQNPTPQMLMDQMRAELEAKMEEKYGKLTEGLKEKEEREAKEQYEAAVNGYKSELTQFIRQNSDTYELIVANNATELMFDTAQQFYKQTGKVPNNEELAKAVEEHLEEQANEILKLKKFQSKLNKPAEPKPTSQTAPTLSNTLAAEVPKSGLKHLSDEDSKKEAAKLLKWGR